MKLAQQRGTTFESMLSEARKMGYTGLECDLWRLSDCVNVRNLFESCGLNVAFDLFNVRFPTGYAGEVA